MAQITFTIDNAQIPRLIEALAQKYGCDETAQAVKAAVQNDWKQITKSYEFGQALLAAQATVVPPTIVDIT